MKLKATILALGLVGMTACDRDSEIETTGDVSRNDIARLDAKTTACAGGGARNLSIGVKADIVRAIRGDVDFNAGLQREIVGAIFEDADISNANTLAAYKIYERCIRELEF